MNRTLRAIVGAALVLVIAFSGISICQNLGRRWKVDVTDQKLYTLSDGTRAILARLNQPIRIRFFYAKTAAMKGPDQIRFFNNYSEFVRALLDEYVAASNGMVELQVIDPRPFSEEEEQALRLGLRRFPITEEENFFFGLAVQTQFGVEKTIPFFSPDRQNFIEYDISYLIDTAITRQKTRLGIMSSLPVMGDDVTGYMAQMMRMQGQQPAPAWTIVEQLRQQYEVTEVPTDATDINDVDILIVIHPKDLPEPTLFAIDQFVLKGGRAIVCVDPHCVVDRPQRSPMQMTVEKQSSDLDRVMRAWGLQMPANTFAGDRSLLLEAPLGANQRPQPVMGFLGLTPPCFNQEKAITADLNQVRVLFAGVLREVTPPGHADAADPNQAGGAGAPEIVRTPLIMTTDQGNSWSVSSSFELMLPDPDKLMARFIDGTQPVPMGYLVTGRFRSSFPEGIEVEVDAEFDEADEEDALDESRTVTKHVTGLTEAVEDCAVAVFSDVDFLSDQLAYANSLFGKMVVGDNSALLINTIEDLSGSGDLISIRSRGNYRRPFTVVDEIERQAERETADEVALINAQIEGFNLELQNLISSERAGEQQEVIGSSIIEKRRQLELKIREAERQLREVNARRRERIEQLGNSLRRFNMGLVPGVVMMIALVLGLWRSFRRRHYISHASDA